MYGGTAINIGCVPTKALVLPRRRVYASAQAHLEGQTPAYESAVVFRS